MTLENKVGESPDDLISVTYGCPDDERLSQTVIMKRSDYERHQQGETLGYLVIGAGIIAAGIASLFSNPKKPAPEQAPAVQTTVETKVERNIVERDVLVSNYDPNRGVVYYVTPKGAAGKALVLGDEIAKYERFRKKNPDIAVKADIFAERDGEFGIKNYVQIKE